MLLQLCKLLFVVWKQQIINTMRTVFHGTTRIVELPMIISAEPLNDLARKEVKSC